MEKSGQIQNGAIVPDQPLSLPEGTRVQFGVEPVEPVEADAADGNARIGGQLKNKIQIADDFDELPGDVAEPFGMESQ